MGNKHFSYFSLFNTDTNTFMVKHSHQTGNTFRLLLLRYGLYLTLKAPVTTSDDIFKARFFFHFSEEIMLDITCELSAWQTIHM